MCMFCVSIICQHAHRDSVTHNRHFINRQWTERRNSETAEEPNAKYVASFDKKKPSVTPAKPSPEQMRRRPGTGSRPKLTPVDLSCSGSRTRPRSAPCEPLWHNTSFLAPWPWLTAGRQPVIQSVISQSITLNSFFSFFFFFQ